MQFVPKGSSPRKITSFTDGTKQSLEMVVLANGTGLVPDKRGMHGVKTTKERLVEDVTSAISRDGVVEYVMGENVNLGMTVFVVGKRVDVNPQVASDLAYLKMGNGPYYLFFRDYHLCYFEAPKSIAELVLFNKPTIAPQALCSDVLTVTKSHLAAGTKLDGIGGFTVYGLIDRYETVRQQNLLPLGLAEFATLTRDVKRDEPVTYDMVDIPGDNLILELRQKQDSHLTIENKQFLS
jgi:predicted homoserine dehydrogenase-like protein